MCGGPWFSQTAQRLFTLTTHMFRAQIVFTNFTKPHVTREISITAFLSLTQHPHCLQKISKIDPKSISKDKQNQLSNRSSLATFKIGMEVKTDRFFCCDLRRGIISWAGFQIILYASISSWIVYKLCVTQQPLRTWLTLMIIFYILSVAIILVHVGVIVGIAYQLRVLLKLALVCYYVWAVILFILLIYSVLTKPTTAFVSIIIFGKLNHQDFKFSMSLIYRTSHLCLEAAQTFL